MNYRVLEQGARGDGIHDDTAAIQACIDACNYDGGGRVIFDGGYTFRSGMLLLRSNIELHFETGAVLKAGDSLEDFRIDKAGEIAEDLEVPSYEDCTYSGLPTLFFLYAKDCEYISITGNGCIDGNEEIFFGNVTPKFIDGSFYPRMPLLYLEHVTHLTIRDVTLQNSAFWTTHMVGCEDVLIDGIRILNNLKLANCDGIDPDHCRNVRISNCHIQTADDGIVFKNTGSAMKYGPCENITVSDCTIISTSAAIKFGTESEAPFRNITVQNCAISRSNRGISLMLRDEGCMENLIFSNLTIDTRQFSKPYWWGDGEPIAITALKRREDTRLGQIRNVLFSNILCTSENGILIYGEDTQTIHDISFDRLTLSLVKKTDYPKENHDLRPNILPEPILKGRPCALFARGAKDLSFDHLKYTISDEMKAFMADPIDIRDCGSISL